MPAKRRDIKQPARMKKSAPQRKAAAEAKTRAKAKPPHDQEPKRACARGVCEPERTQGLRAPAPKGTHTLVSVGGPGVFVAAEVHKQGGRNGLTFVSLDLDGRNVTNISFDAARNVGFTQQNPFGLVLLSWDSIDTLTIGFAVPLRFESKLELSVIVQEEDVVQVLGNVIHGAA